LTYLKNKFNLV